MAGGEAATLVLAMREREKRRELIAQELRELQKPLPARQDAAKLKESLLSRLMDWKGLLRATFPRLAKWSASSSSIGSFSRPTPRPGPTRSRRLGPCLDFSVG